MCSGAAENSYSSHLSGKRGLSSIGPSDLANSLVL